jgi:16S rRNA (guanine527-N7)-methyltransferase
VQAKLSQDNALKEYVDLLVEWNQGMNLVSPKSIPYIWDRHIADCVQLAEYLPRDKTIYDIGSGAGLPGMVLSILGFNVQLVEKDERKCVFLGEASRVGGVKPLVHNMRVENFKAAPGGLITARAFAPLAELFKLTRHLGGDYVLLKGENAMAEISEAKKGWNFEYDLHPSRTGSGFILIIKGLQEVL